MTNWREGREPPMPAEWQDIVAKANVEIAIDECPCVCPCPDGYCTLDGFQDALRDAVLLAERYRAALQLVERELRLATQRGRAESGNSIAVTMPHYDHLIGALVAVRAALDEGEGA